MKGYITESQFDNIKRVPIGSAQTELLANDSICLQVVKLDVRQVLTVGYTGVQLIKVTPGTPDLINTSLGLIYFGIFAGGFDTLRTPSGTPINWVSFNGPSYQLMSPYAIRNFAGPDIIHFVMVNNTTNLDVEYCVTGTCFVSLR